MKEKLEKELKLYERQIKSNPNNAQALYAKAGILVKLRDLAGDEPHKKAELNKEALECYSKAIKLNPDNPDYFADRSKLYVAMGANELAIEDIQKIKALPESSNPIAKMYLNNTVKEISRLDSVQSTIQKLQAEGKIDPALANALAEHAKVTANLVVQVGSHGERLDGHDSDIENLNFKTEELISIVKALSEGRKVDAEQIIKLTQDTRTLKAAVDQNSIRIQGIEEQMSRAVTDIKKGIAKAAQSDEATKSLLEAKISSIEGQLSSLAKAKDVSKIVVDMKKMIGENKFTKESLDDLQSQIDEMKESAQPLAVRMFNEVMYDNPLLNYPELLKNIISGTQLNKVLNLGSRLSEGLLTEAVENGDLELLLAGLESLDYA